MARASRMCVICNSEFFAPPSSGNRSCGNADCVTAASKRKGVTHGYSRTRLYGIWSGMKRRVGKSAWHSSKKYYKGLSVCKQWSSFPAFREWAMSNGYDESLEIDRKDNTKGYSPDNCRWATRSQQMQNTRKQSGRNKTSKYKGVGYVAHCAKKWRAQGRVDSKPKHIGLFDTEEEAAVAYDSWAKIAYGEFACLNFKEK